MSSEEKRVEKSREGGRGGAATLADVAARAGVSTVAASVVLNGSRSEARVSASTRERIIEAASALRYSPNAVARSLRQRRTDVIAFHTVHGRAFDPRYPFHAAVLAGLQQGCEEHGKGLLLRGRLEESDDEQILRRLLDGQVDGLVLYARAATPLTQRLVESHLPVVSVVNEVPGVPWVGIDDALGGRLQARHLAERGYNRVLYRRTDEEMPATLRRRFEAFCQEAQVLGLSLLHSRNNSPEPSEHERELLLAPGGVRPEAVACWSDYAADGIAEFCLSHGLSVPQDVAIVGFDGLAPARRPALRLSTIAAPWHEVAREAVGLLALRAASKEVPEKTVLPVEMVVGDTT